MPTLTVDLHQVRIFLSILLRLGLCIFLLPVFRARQVPAPAKAWGTVALSALSLPLVGRFIEPFPLSPFQAAGFVVSELVFASLFALTMHILFGAFHMAGQLVSFQMGLGFAQVADPQSGTQNVLLGQFLQILATLIFFSVNGHLLVIKVFLESFQTIPVGGFFPSGEVFRSVIAQAGQLFVIAIKIAAPILSVQLLLQVAFGVVAKFSPQINILIASFPITIAVGILFAIFSLAGWNDLLAHHLARLIHFFQAVSH
ncbi:flagellar biosynthetic protein FliR [Desulfacinum hydrothermale DSM 13146]|uniref:Flagellar biosynthetic protein FliR n=1 Tax=Desulfacinum hydrothermale DSM 13146 TaxID=1121390 RepID=A0A1W1X604_9BACT|nr:flagellar biosynthetic protein FliR [Desulfacinum hydrothermale]SMC19352.1 flagellar biosynthetic protein FliR [Desulfacinum hydrothermale DSM 13146]